MKYLDKGAQLSEDGCYRYWLSRRLSMGERMVLFVGLNPSTADAEVDDPTIRRCVGFARSWGFDWYFMGNLHAWRSTDPKALKTVEEPVGPENIDHLHWMARKAEIVVCAWGANPIHRNAETTAGWLMALPHARCLGQTKDRAPKHPLYLASNTPLVEIQR